MLDAAFEALKKYDWGTDLAAVAPIENAVALTYGKAEERKDLETRLVAALNGQLTRDAQDYVCRKLAIVGTDVCVPALKPLLLNKGNSHMARYALERIQGPAAAQALRDSITAVEGDLKVGIISSIGSRRDTEAVQMLSGLIGDSNLLVARAAILALGAIGTTNAADALKAALGSSSSHLTYAADAMMSCAEKLLASDQTGDARAIYQQFAQERLPRNIRLAATRGLLACASKQA